MAKIANGYIVLGVSTVLWDGINFPDKTDGKDGKEITDRFQVEIAFPADMPEYVNELWPDAQAVAAAANPRGVPSNVNWGIHQVDAQKIPECAGQMRMRATTYRDRPKVFDVNGVELSDEQIRGAIYGGAKVRIIVKPDWFDFDKNKGVRYFLDAIQVVDPTAPRLAIANRGLSTDTARSAFAAAPVQGVPVGSAAQAALAPQPVPQPVAPQAAPAPVPQPVAPQGGAPAAPTPVVPNYGAVPGAVPPAGAAAPAAPGAQPVPAASPAPQAPSPQNAPVAPTSPSNQLTPQALTAWPGATYEQWIANGWTHEQLVAAGYVNP